MNFILVVFLLFVSTCYGAIDNSCLACICQVETRCQQAPPKWDVDDFSAGYYQIKPDYYTDCGKPGNSWLICVNVKSCADTCVRNYMSRYGTYCTGGRTPTCQDYARIHNGGPTGCRNPATLGYWQKVQQCLNANG
ncbi:unnamed protein product [Didymodactylos carnosus]|uniref:lysozyme n=1 Tax=Didymodactylos carnosus TaxID=1234261 RepID=A0A814Y6V7_9BILA|nr:unnamed protein product [Didymodactylos carnosus]CAF1225270.1 unnamed protein product [Didymodactylos carnosus]CAF3988210.1 unnamed protein product [Didymodactylos carnosus]CAF4010097.1 unnamed protein product [Didymodactylos carnosus]